MLVGAFQIRVRRAGLGDRKIIDPAVLAPSRSELYFSELFIWCQKPLFIDFCLESPSLTLTSITSCSPRRRLIGHLSTLQRFRSHYSVIIATHVNKYQDLAFSTLDFFNPPRKSKNRFNLLGTSILVLLPFRDDRYMTVTFIHCRTNYQTRN
jgi:hypothetical protein